VDNMLQARAGDAKVLVGGGDGEGNLHVYVEGDLMQTVDKDSGLRVLGSRKTEVKRWEDHEVLGDLSFLVHESMSLHGKVRASLTSKGAVTIVAPEISLGWDDSNFIRIGPGGVTIVGTVVNINSGGTRLKGFYTAPAPWPDAEKAAPTAPAAADDAKSGQKSS
jgi:type VI secretion system secreted protein VgrG